MVRVLWAHSMKIWILSFQCNPHSNMIQIQINEVKFVNFIKLAGVSAFFYLCLYRIVVRITLKEENPYLHSVNSKKLETILRHFSSITPGQTDPQFTAEWTETLIITSPLRGSRMMVWYTTVPHQETLFPSCNWILEGSSTNDYRTRGHNWNGISETVTHPITNIGTCCLTSLIDENWCCQHATP